MTLEIKNLHVEIEGKEILKGINLTLEKGKIHALMGPNGSGKSTLANVIMGHPKYEITKGEILFNGENINELPPDERAKKGIFLSFQYPTEVSGVTISNFLRTALNNLTPEEKHLSVMDFRELLKEKLETLNINEEFAERYLNEGFSGGEKKKSEILQMAVLNPKAAILDETDSGMDVDALKVVSEGINKMMNPDKIILIITHYKRILELIKPDKLSILINGKIALEGDNNLVDQLEEKGYGWIEQD
tara:strand:- start:27456 stop:28196 length:741 start_codon:yes stop_codon:yes gene_type:complete